MSAKEKASAGTGKAQGARMLVARRVTLSFVLVAVLVSLAFDSGLGTPSTFGVGEFFLLCPLGGLEAMVASRSFIPVAAISMAVVLVFALVFGRAWCAWGCPAPVIRRFFKRDPKPESQEAPAEGAVPALNGGAASSGAANGVAVADGTPAYSAASPAQSNSVESSQAPAPTPGLAAGLKRVGRDSRTWAFIAVLAAALVAGFPLFCLVCPVGLTFGTVGSLWHLIVDKQMTLSVLVFPAALLVELVLYRKWCLNLCPIAGLPGIVGQLARLFRPRVNASTCLRYGQGIDCKVCTAACAERIDLHAADAGVALGECTRCGECAAQCPTASIALKLSPGAAVVRAEGGEDACTR